MGIALLPSICSVGPYIRRTVSNASLCVFLLGFGLPGADMGAHTRVGDGMGHVERRHLPGPPDRRYGHASSEHA